jgi:hypothetical protein
LRRRAVRTEDSLVARYGVWSWPASTDTHDAAAPGRYRPLMVDSLRYVLAELDEWEHDEERSQDAFRAPISAATFATRRTSAGALKTRSRYPTRADAPLENMMILLPGPPVRGSVPERVATTRNVRDLLSHLPERLPPDPPRTGCGAEWRYFTSQIGESKRHLTASASEARTSSTGLSVRLFTVEWSLLR